MKLSVLLAEGDRPVRRPSVSADFSLESGRQEPFGSNSVYQIVVVKKLVVGSRQSVLLNSVRLSFGQTILLRGTGNS